MWKNINIFAFCLVLQLNAFAQTPSRDPAALAAEALVEARAGHQKEAIALYEQALAIDPTNIAILRDYAVVLGWSEKYSEAIAVVKKLRKLDNDQPTWALNEFARSYLFGGATAGALSILNELVEKVAEDSACQQYRTLLAVSQAIVSHRDLAGLFHDLASRLRRAITPPKQARSFRASLCSTTSTLSGACSSISESSAWRWRSAGRSG